MAYVIKRGKSTITLDFCTSFDLHVPFLDIIKAPPLEDLDPKECSICGDTSQIESIFDSIHPCSSKFCKQVNKKYNTLLTTSSVCNLI